MHTEHRREDRRGVKSDPLACNMGCGRRRCHLLSCGMQENEQKIQGPVLTVILLDARRHSGGGVRNGGRRCEIETWF